MNIRRALGWFRDRLAAIAVAGGLSVRVGRRFVTAADGDDVDAWLIGQEMPSRVALRKHGPARLAALGGEIAS